MLRHVEMWSPHVEICGDVEICRGVESTCGDMWIYVEICGGVSTCGNVESTCMWRYVSVWRNVEGWSPHVEICGAVMSVGCGV